MLITSTVLSYRVIIVALAHNHIVRTFDSFRAIFINQWVERGGSVCGDEKTEKLPNFLTHQSIKFNVAFSNS